MAQCLGAVRSVNINFSVDCKTAVSTFFSAPERAFYLGDDPVFLRKLVMPYAKNYPAFGAQIS